MNNGTVNLTINDETEVIQVINSQVNKTISTVGLDLINVVATYSGYDNYAFKTISRVFEIKPTDEYEILINVDDALLKVINNNDFSDFDQPDVFMKQYQMKKKQL